MIISKQKIPGVHHIKVKKHTDERGYFARTMCSKAFMELGLPHQYVQSSLSFNKKKGTLRGLHYEITGSEGKLVSCVAGEIFDVIIDIRSESPTYKEWLGFTLSADNADMVYIAPGLAHGFQTLCDSSTVLYQMTDYYCAEHSRGYRWNSPALKIQWPIEVECISEKDKSSPIFSE